MFHEVRIIGEILILAVLKHEDAAGRQQVPLKNQVGNLRQLLEGIRGVGKDEVELLMTAAHEAEDVGPQGQDPSRPPLLRG